MIRFDRLNMSFNLNFDQTLNFELIVDYNDLDFDNLNDLNNWLIVSSDNFDKIMNIK